jgi:hypothetical protein
VHWRPGGTALGAPLPGQPFFFIFAEIKLSQETIVSTEIPQHLLPPSRSDHTARRRDELRRIAQEGSGEFAFVSSDRTVMFTFEEMAALKEWCPAIVNMRRIIYGACCGWLQRVPVDKRKSVLIEWLLENGESMSPPKPRKRRSTAPHAPQTPPAAADRSGPIPDFETYVQRFLKDEDDEQTRREIEDRCRESWERKKRREAIESMKIVRPSIFTL